MDRVNRKSRERPESSFHVSTENTQTIGSPITFGRSMRLHLDDVRFDEPETQRQDFCPPTVPQGQADRVISLFPKLRSFPVNDDTSQCECCNNEVAMLKREKLARVDGTSVAPAFDSFLRRVPSAGPSLDNYSVRHRSASPTQRRVHRSHSGSWRTSPTVPSSFRITTASVLRTDSRDNQRRRRGYCKRPQSVHCAGRSCPQYGPVGVAVTDSSPDYYPIIHEGSSPRSPPLKVAHRQS